MATNSTPAAPTATSELNVALPTIALPKGGGAIRGIGETFSANTANGAASLTIPIATPAGRSGFGPNLALHYDSGSGNGSFGLGWTLATPSITRKTDRGLPRYRDEDDSDVFILAGAEDLVPVRVKGPGGWAKEPLGDRNLGGQAYRLDRYRPRVEGLFARIERWTNRADPTDVFWRSISRDNVQTFYGRDSTSRIFDPTDPTRIFSWLISDSRDDKGNGRPALPRIPTVSTPGD